MNEKKQLFWINNIYDQGKPAGMMLE